VLEDVGGAGEEDGCALGMDIVGVLVVLEGRLGRAGDVYRGCFALSASVVRTRGRSEREGGEIRKFEGALFSLHRSMWVSRAGRD